MKLKKRVGGGKEVGKGIRRKEEGGKEKRKIEETGRTICKWRGMQIERRK